MSYEIHRARNLDKFIGYHIAIEDENDIYYEGLIEEFHYIPEKAHTVYNDRSGEVEAYTTPAVIRLKFAYQDEIVVIDNIPVRVYVYA